MELLRSSFDLSLMEDCLYSFREYLKELLRLSPFLSALMDSILSENVRKSYCAQVLFFVRIDRVSILSEIVSLLNKV